MSRRRCLAGSSAAGGAGLAALALALLGAACGDNWSARPDAGGGDSQVDGPDNPPPPELGEIFDRRGRPLTAELLIGIDLPAGPAREAAHQRFARTSDFNWRSYEAEIARSLALYDGLDSEAAAGDRCGYPGMSYAALASIFADDRLYVDTEISVCRGSNCRDYLAVERSFIPPLRLRDSCGGNALSYDVVDASYTALIKDPDPDPPVTPISDGVEPHGDIDNTSFPFLGREHR